MKRSEFTPANNEIRGFIWDSNGGRVIYEDGTSEELPESTKKNPMNQGGKKVFLETTYEETMAELEKILK